jgi:MOSC domain-containing protein YiiM
MRRFDELERLWQRLPPLPRGRGTVKVICVRKGGGVHECPPQVKVTLETGVDGDRWFDSRDRDPEAQVTVMSARAAELVAGDHRAPHEAGDNFLVDLELAAALLPPGTRLRMGSALIEVSAKPHTGCKKFRERFGLDALRWVNHRHHKGRRLRGINCRVISAGEVAVGDVIEVVPTSSAGEAAG